MLRSLLRASAAVAFAFLVAPAAPEAAPAPGLAYDEIVRVVANSTPPPPGNFSADVAAIGTAPAVAAATPQPRKHGFNLGSLTNIAGTLAGGGSAGNVAGAVVGTVAGQAISEAMSNSIQRSVGAQFGGLAASALSFLQPHLMHYAYWNGWERSDDIAAQTATIRKCDAGQVIYLDLAHQTYRIYEPASEPPAPVAAPPPVRGGPPPGPSTPQPPGTAVIDLSSSTKALGPLRIQDQTTAGYDSTATIAISRATGSCHDGNSSIEETQYLAAVARPAVNNCPIRRRPIPQSAEEVVTIPSAPTGGCRPTFTAHRSGPTPPSNRLALYSLVSFSGGATATPAAGAGKVGFLTERGNLKTLGPADAGLFSIPQGFTKSP